MGAPMAAEFGSTGVFRCAGLIVPEPSIMVPPMPFMEEVTGCVAEYMATDDGTTAGSGDQRPPLPQLALGDEQRRAEWWSCTVEWTSVSVTGKDALGVACRPLAGKARMD